MGYQDATGIVVGLFSTPVFYKGVIYAGNNDGLTYAVDATTGKLRWVRGNTISEHAAATIAIVANDVVYAGNGDKGNHSIRYRERNAKMDLYETGNAVFRRLCRRLAKQHPHLGRIR